MGRLLGYDLRFTRDAGGPPVTLAELVPLEGPDAIAYAGLGHPSFFIGRPAPRLACLHGSCRMLHGKDEDALVLGDLVVARNAADLSVRPSALYLTGDQIYADDVAGPLALWIRKLAPLLAGDDEPTSVPGLPAVNEIPLYERGPVVSACARLTSDEPYNHLVTFGEMAAMYTVSWNPEMWPAAWEPPPGHLSLRRRQRYQKDVVNLESARAGITPVRRLLANVPTYTMFDDHDVTDDWNLTREWKREVHATAAGRRIIANALASYWAFQGWGNDPRAYPAPFKRSLEAHLSRGGRGTGESYEQTLWSFDKWAYCAPTTPVTLALDTRTRRGYDDDRSPSRLVPRAELEDLTRLLAGAGYEPGDPLIVISAVPVFGFEVREQTHRMLIRVLGPYHLDLEGWRSNLRGFTDFMVWLCSEVKPSYCVFLSGDVHYAFNIEGSFRCDDREVRVVQLTSSPQKNTGLFQKVGVALLGRIVRKRDERLGWNVPPRPTRRKLWARVKMQLAFAGEGMPLFLTHKDAEKIGVAGQSHYRERRVYVRPSGPTSSFIVGSNNLGFALITPDRVVHRLASPRGGRGVLYTAAMHLEDRDG